MGAFCCLHHPAAVQRNAIAAFRHRFTLRQTRRTVPIIFSIESCRPALVTVQLTQFLAAPVGWLSGRIEARTGLRMMPTFPRPSLSVGSRTGAPV